MRNVYCWNQDWFFTKEGTREKVQLPHTWNALDGQDGGDDYYRGCCCYEKEFAWTKEPGGQEVWLEFLGVSAIAEVFVNGIFVGRHEGGYSAFRCNITQALREQNHVRVLVDNSPNDRVYPQKADFTFYGGIYRDVHLIVTPGVHIALDLYGGPGVRVTPKLEQGTAQVTVETWLNGVKREDSPEQFAAQEQGNALELEVLLKDQEGNLAGQCRSVLADCPAGPENPGEAWGVPRADAVQTLCIQNPRLWQGIADPYLYSAQVRLWQKGELLDEVTVPFGCRTYSVDPEQGFFLNGRAYPLRGVSRHQDREGVGCALLPEMHREDMELIRETGANSIRLAHYQHDPYFYDLCDRCGMVVWAEIPYITVHMANGRENTISQMRELILQNCHHPAICFWGLSNEVTVGGDSAQVLENNQALQRLAKALDADRLTTMACAFMIDEASPLLEVADVIAYNHYFGWYFGDLDANEEWCDSFHSRHPKLPVGLSEYGAEAVLKWQTGKPERGDYTEQYQALYHEHMLRMFETRPYLWCTYVWNMFDFAADGRNEGGVSGRNNKGLVTFDRKEKKDAFYLYKAYWSGEPFVYLAGKRYRNRSERESEFIVYTNQEQAALYQNGRLVESRKGCRVFRFQVSLEAENEILVTSGESLADSGTFFYTEQPDPAYRLPAVGSIANWFDDLKDLRQDCFTLEDTVGALVQNPEGLKIFKDFMAVYDSRKKGAAAASHMTEEQRMMTMRSMRLKELIRRTNTPEEEARALLDRLQQVKNEAAVHGPKGRE